MSVMKDDRNFPEILTCVRVFWEFHTTSKKEPSFWVVFMPTKTKAISWIVKLIGKPITHIGEFWLFTVYLIKQIGCNNDENRIDRIYASGLWLEIFAIMGQLFSIIQLNRRMYEPVCDKIIHENVYSGLNDMRNQRASS